MFTHLHVHSHYSLLDSTVKVPDLVKRAAELGMDAVAITDHGNLHNCIEFQSKAKGAGVKPIFGLTIDVVPAIDDPRAKPHHLVLLAETLEGYKNLVRLVAETSLRNEQAGQPVRASYDDLRRYHGGIIALSGDLGGEIPLFLMRGDDEGAKRSLDAYLDIFGPDHFFIEVQRYEGIPEQADATQRLVKFARKHRVPVVATNNVHYLHAADFKAHGILMCIGMEKRIDRTMLDKVPLRSLYLRSAEDMDELFSDLPDAIQNTKRIADRCNVEIPTGTYYLPRFDVPEGHTEDSFMREIAKQGLERRFDEFRDAAKTFDTQEYYDRLSVELDIIIQMGFPGYFLIVQDFINWAKNQDIPVGPGRGSGAGSLVAYSLRITDLDPIPYGLLFERFLNPERVSMPDFDIDFCQNRRGEVIDYVSRKYGENNVAMIVTFGQLKAKAVVRDVARVLNLSFSDADRLSKLIPNELNIKLREAYEKEPRLRQEVESDDTIQFLYDTGLALEGNNRNTGIHAAGVVISEKPLWEHVPVSRGASGEIVSQYAKNEVEDAGLVKFDFLGLKTLTVIDDAVRMVNKARPADDPLDFNKISLDEPAVYKLIKTGDTTGIFQMESEGFQRLMRQLKPDCFEDIVAAVALYRPGPLGSGMVEQFIECKHGRREVEYPHPWLEDVLRETYGVMVYQEQVMKVAQILAGYSLGGADLLRRAMGKKKASVMDQQRKVFIEGAATNDISEQKANEIFDLMAHFAGYGFNKSHSAAYALLTFQTGYLKAYHPNEFYASLMTNDANSTSKVVKYIIDARNRGISVLPPDVNASEESFAVDEGAIRFGLGAVKGVGSGPIEAIIEARDQQEFVSLFDFCERVDSKRCNKRVLEALIQCGAFDSIFVDFDEALTGSLVQIGRWRACMLAALDKAVERGQKAQRDKASGQSSLFGMFAEAMPAEASADVYPDVKGWDPRAVLTFEKQTLGFYVSGHPLDRFRDVIGRYTDANSTSLHTREARDKVTMAAVITSRRERITKDGKGRMAFLQLEDHFGEYEGIVYSRAYDDLVEVLDSEEPMLVSGNVRDDFNGEETTKKLVVESMKPLEEARASRVREALLTLDSEDMDEEMMRQLQVTMGAHPGSCRLVLNVRFGTADARIELPEEVRVASSEAFVNDVTSLVGENRVTFR